MARKKNQSSPGPVALTLPEADPVPEPVQVDRPGWFHSGVNTARGYVYPPLPEGVKLDYILEPLRPFAVPIKSLHFDPANPRLHNDVNLKAIRDSLAQFGQDQPLVVQREGMIVRKGNGRLEAALSLEWEYIAALILDEETIKAVARGIADNRSAELAEWDYQILAQLMRTLKDGGQDLTALGWQPHEYETLLQANWQPPALSDDETSQDQGPAMGSPIHLTVEQRQTVDEALDRLRDQEHPHGRDLTEGRLIELICADWLGGATLPEESETEAETDFQPET